MRTIPSWVSNIRLTRIVFWRTSRHGCGNLGWNFIQTRRAWSSSGGMPNRTGNEEGRANLRPFDFLGFTHISGKNGKGHYTVRRMTVRKRMRKKLQELKQQLCRRMHDPVPQTGGWLRSVLQGYFNYYAVPGNLNTLGLFRNRVLRLWGKTLRRRSQKSRFTWARRVALAEQWLPRPQKLHPYPEVRFAASHPR